MWKPCLHLTTVQAEEMVHLLLLLDRRRCVQSVKEGHIVGGEAIELGDLEGLGSNEDSRVEDASVRADLDVLRSSVGHVDCRHTACQSTSAPSGPTHHSQQQHHIKSSRARACKCDARQTEPVAWCVVGGRRGECCAHPFIVEKGRKGKQSPPKIIVNFPIH